MPTPTDDQRPNHTAPDLADRLAGLARDAAYIAIGAGVLTVQRLQVRRRELAHIELVNRLEQAVSDVDRRVQAVEARVDAAVEAIEQHLPAQAATMLGQAHGMARTARQQVRNIVLPAA
jgi:Holliday junction resolvasome RuvABC endonuclease subunit